MAVSVIQVGFAGSDGWQWITPELDMSMCNGLFAMLPPCCNLAAVPVQALAERERKFFASFMPDAVTAIVMAHHVVTEEEWTWYHYNVT